MAQAREIELMEAEASFHESLSEASRVMEKLNVDSPNISFSTNTDLDEKSRIAYYDLLQATHNMVSISMELFRVLCREYGVSYTKKC